MRMSMSMGTRVTARSDEKPTASVLVQASGRNMRPSCASKRNTGRKETTMMRSEKNRAGPTCLAASSRIRRLSRSLTGGRVSGRGAAARVFVDLRQGKPQALGAANQLNPLNMLLGEEAEA